MKIEPIPITELRSGRCACVVPVAPFPMYCGLPVSNAKLRMCEHHAKAYLNDRTSNKTSTDKFTNRSRTRSIG
jgi:hypothetical protein